jgi:hypothetical protein
MRSLYLATIILLGFALLTGSNPQANSKVEWKEFWGIDYRPDILRQLDNLTVWTQVDWDVEDQVPGLVVFGIALQKQATPFPGVEADKVSYCDVSGLAKIGPARRLNNAHASVYLGKFEGKTYYINCLCERATAPHQCTLETELYNYVVASLHLYPDHLELVDWNQLQRQFQAFLAANTRTR